MSYGKEEIMTEKKKTLLICGLLLAVCLLELLLGWQYGRQKKYLMCDELFTYTSSNKNVATVNSKGVITAKKKGTAVITVKSGTRKVTCKVTVK